MAKLSLVRIVLGLGNEQRLLGAAAAALTFEGVPGAATRAVGAHAQAAGIGAVLGATPCAVQSTNVLGAAATAGRAAAAALAGGAAHRLARTGAGTRTRRHFVSLFHVQKIVVYF